jgi:hypothetical protein
MIIVKMKTAPVFGAVFILTIIEVMLTRGGGGRRRGA